MYYYIQLYITFYCAGNLNIYSTHSACDSIRFEYLFAVLCAVLFALPRSNEQCQMTKSLTKNAHERRTISEIKIDTQCEINRRRKTAFKLNHSAKSSVSFWFSFLFFLFSSKILLLLLLPGKFCAVLCEKMPEKRERQKWKGDCGKYKKKTINVNATLCARVYAG